MKALEVGAPHDCFVDAGGVLAGSLPVPNQD